MGRPAKPVAISSGKISKETKNKRKETEEKLLTALFQNKSM